MIDRTLTENDYVILRKFLEENSGIVLGDNKQYLVVSRLVPIVMQYKMHSLNDLIKKISQPEQRALRIDIIDAMTTNETLWFRDKYPFDIFKDNILESFRGIDRPIRIWSAACSSGQEPYSLAMSFLEFQQKRMGALSKGIDIVATDLSLTMLELCKRGEYSDLLLSRGLSDERKDKFFDLIEPTVMRIKPNVRNLVTFKQHNLLSSYSPLGKFDIIFCRNVLIYFSSDVKENIIRQFGNSLNPGGILMLGASESLTNLQDIFDVVKLNPGIYFKKK